MEILTNSSQPYLYYDNNSNINMLYCHGEGMKTLFFGNSYSIKAWKIYHKNYLNNYIVKVSTPKHINGLGSVILECNPHIYQNYLYCTLGTNAGHNKPLEYHLCRFEFSEINDTLLLGEVEVLQKTFTGTYYNGNLIFADPRKNGNLIISNTQTAESSEIVLPVQYVYKLNKIFNTDQFIVTGQTETNQYCSYLYDNQWNLIKEITNSNGEPIYKCSILDNILIYTVKNDTSAEENRSLVQESWPV